MVSIYPQSRTIGVTLEPVSRPPVTVTITPPGAVSVPVTVTVQPRAVQVQVVTGQSSPSPGAGVTRLENDPSPTLGGNLTLNAKEILGTLEGAALVIDGGLLG